MRWPLLGPINPGGIVTYGWVMYKDDKKIAEDCAVICSVPKATNNLAEYTAVIQALKWLNENGYNTEKSKFAQIANFVCISFQGYMLFGQIEYCSFIEKP